MSAISFDNLVARLETVIAMNRQDKMAAVPRDLLLECRAAIIARDLLALESQEKDSQSERTI